VLYVRAIGGHWVVVVEALDMLAGGTLGCLESIQLTVRACKRRTSRPNRYGTILGMETEVRARGSEAHVCGCAAA
jgi:hypothetical protein